MKYCILNGKIAEKGIHKKDICKELGISFKSFANKLNGKTEFTWSQVCTIQRVFFPEIDKDCLFKG